MVPFDGGPKIEKPVNTTFYRLLKKIDQAISGEGGRNLIAFRVYFQCVGLGA
jgi:hypothetical protein